MNKQKLYTLLAALLCAMATWAQEPTSVSTENELRAAVQINNVNILLANNINLSELIEITGSTTVTINLNGHTLDRGLKWRGNAGQVFAVRSGATLNLSNGTLTGGWGGNSGGIDNNGTANLTDVIITGCTADDRGGAVSNRAGGTFRMTGGAITNNTCFDHGDPAGGGGIFNYEGATMTLTGVTITGNEDMVCGGGGICNYGTLNLDGCTITGNKARTVGGGIWSGNEKHLLKMQGANIITDNFASGVPSNLFMLERRWITITGSITGSRIGVMLDVAPNQFTNGYATYHNGEDPNTFFTYDKPWVDSLGIIQPDPHVGGIGEVIMLRKNLRKKVPYFEHSWDSENKKVVSTTKMLTEEIGLNDTPTSETQYKKLKSSDLYVDLGTKDSELHEFYVVEGDEINIYALDVIGPNVHIILRDSAWLNLQHEIGVEKGNTVYIHAQSTGSYMGKLTAGGGIGGYTNEEGANIEIHGGNFDLQGTENCAAIGGQYETNGNITIFDGRIKATGMNGGVAGIGGGYGCTNYGNIFIYGGTIEATSSPGIGGGPGCLNGNLTIWDGAITAHGIGESAGIGSNQFSDGYGAGTITINGGYVRAYGDQYGAGIGGGDGVRGGTLNVNGGHVEAYGGTDAAGIGGGEGGNGGYVTINDGYVYAEGNDNGAGIGGGEDGAGADVTINGGTVIATSGGDQHAIGAGHGSDSHGNLTFADDLGVLITQNLYRSEKDNRVKDCRENKYVRIIKCAHGGATATIVDGKKHSISNCKWCLVTNEEAHTFGDYGQCPICGLISLNNDADNSGIITYWAEDEDPHTVVLSGRKLVKGGAWNTLCLPFSLTSLTGSPLAGATVKTLESTAFEDGTLTMNFSEGNLGSIEAGYPYIVKWTGDDVITDPVFNGVTISKTTTNVETQYADFIGTYSPVAIAGEDRTMLYMGGDNKLYYPNAALTINAFRCYFLLNGITAGDLVGNVSAFVMNFDGGDDATGLTPIPSPKGEGNWFDLNGRKLQGRPTAKGVYIINGRKVVIK